MYKGVQGYHLWNILIDFESLLHFHCHPQIAYQSHALYLTFTWNFWYFFSNNVWEKNFNPNSSNFFRVKTFRNMVNIPMWTHNLKGIYCVIVQWCYTKCTRKIYKVYKGNVLSVQGCTRLLFVKDFNRFWITSLFFLITHGLYIKFVLLYKGITLNVQGKCTNCIRQIH